MIDFDTASVEEIAAEMADAAETIEELAQDPDNQAWIESAMVRVMVDPTTESLMQKAQAFEE